MQDIKKIELNSNLIDIFRGRYETIWCEAKDYEQEQEELEQDKELSSDNYRTMQDILEAYQSNVSASDFNINFIKDIEFTGTFSPKQYNYSTDVLDFTLEVSMLELLEALEALKDNQDFKDFLKKNYSDRSGFWSYTPNNYQDLWYSITSEDGKFDQSISALITFLAGKERLQAIELEAFYNCY
jgi:hypothetical protein